ncbi:MAG: signal peptidase I [Bacilli bacterium]
MKFIKSVLPYVVIIIIIILMRSFIVSPAVVSGESMMNTLYDNEIVLVNKISLHTKKIERYDLVVVNFRNEKIIKRVIALPNEKIEYRENKLFINDKEIKTPIKFEETDDFSFKTKDNEYFVMGDNRDDSLDSRVIGSINEDDIKGKVHFVLFPFNKFGRVK